MINKESTQEMVRNSDQCFEAEDGDGVDVVSVAG
jgi:hypothetical protein